VNLDLGLVFQIGARFVRNFSIILFIGLILACVAGADSIELENGDKLDVTIIEETDIEIVVEHPQLGQMRIPRGALKPPEKPKPGLFGTNFLSGWNRNVGAGISGSNGNSDDASANASLAVSRSTETFKGDFKSSVFFATTDGERTTNEVFANYQHNFILTDTGYFVFVQGRYQYDEFQAWGHRLSSGTGLGYDFLKTKKWALSLQLGVGTARTWGSEDEWRAEGVLGFNLAWTPIDGHEFTADATYYPDFNDAPDFRLLANTAYTMSVTQIEGLSLKTGAKNEYDSGQPGKDNNLKYYGNLVYDF